jgi:hypothetical protein
MRMSAGAAMHALTPWHCSNTVLRSNAGNTLCGVCMLLVVTALHHILMIHQVEATLTRHEQRRQLCMEDLHGFESSGLWLKLQDTG